MYDPLTALLIGILAVGFGTLLVWPKGGLIGYFQKMRRLSDRVMREDALKHIHKSLRHGQQPTLESLAGALQINTGYATKILERMQEQGLVELEGESFTLSPAGKDYAVQIIRAHRLWERYLYEKTGYAEAEWHDIAEMSEHDLSLSDTVDLSAYLGNPTHDPHGDPIPTADGELVLHGGKPLPSMPLDKPLQIVHVEDEPDTVYAQLVAEGIYPGMRIQMIESGDKRIRFVSNGREHILAPIVASNISVVEIAPETIEEKIVGEPLSVLKPGERGEVLALSARFRGSERRRMMDLGILPGTIIQAEMDSPGGDPTAYRIRGALIALRDDQADLIRIKAKQETV